MILGQDRQDLNYKSESGTNALRSHVESTIVSGDNAATSRISKYTLYWNFYKGEHWRQYNQTFLSFNYCKAFIDKVNTFLLGKTGFTTSVKRFDNDKVSPEEESAIEGFVDYHWNRSSKLKTSYEMLQMGSICGDAWVHLQWLSDKNYVDIQVLDSRHCMPKFTNGDLNKLESFQIRQPLGENTQDYKLFVIEYTKDLTRQWYQKDTEIGGKRFSEKEDSNTYGFVPIVHIPNKPTSEGYYSTSDIADILKINKVYNELTQEVKSIIDYYGTPTTVITGGTAKSLRKGIGNIWSGLPPEANVFNLGLGEDLSGTMEFLKLLKTSMHELSDVPENALGKLQAISNTSAAALQITYQPLIQQADIKWITYGQGIADINSMLVQIVKKVSPNDKLLLKLPKGDVASDYLIEPVFKYGLPQDKTVQLNQASLALSMKLNSRQKIMDELGVKNIPEVLNEIDDDLLRQSRVVAEGMALTNEITGVIEEGGETPIQGTPNEDVEEVE